MAKQTMIPMPGGSSSVLPKLITAAVLIALVLVVVKHPGDSAEWVKTLFAAGESVVDGLATFLHKLSA